MGLDITARSQMERCPEHPEREHPDWDASCAAGHSLPYDNEAFPGRLDGLADCCYRPTAQTEEHSFRAGSYGGYNRWREELSLMALGIMPCVVWEDFAAYSGKPFAELIHFADNEGTLGPVVSARLARDFEDWKERAESYTPRDGDGEWFRAKYRDWSRAFRLAADGGFVELH